MGFDHNIFITFLREYAMRPITLEDIDEAEFVDCTQALAVRRGDRCVNDQDRPTRDTTMSMIACAPCMLEGGR